MGTAQIIKRINAFEMKCYRKMLRIPWIAHRTNCSILNELHPPTNWLYNFVRHKKLKYFGHVTRHNGLEKTIMQGIVAGKSSRGKPRHRWEKDITDTFGTMAAASRVAEDRHQFRRDGQRRPDEDMLREEELFFSKLDNTTPSKR